MQITVRLKGYLKARRAKGSKENKEMQENDKITDVEGAESIGTAASRAGEGNPKKCMSMQGKPYSVVSFPRTRELPRRAAASHADASLQPRTNSTTSSRTTNFFFSSSLHEWSIL